MRVLNKSVSYEVPRLYPGISPLGHTLRGIYVNAPSLIRGRLLCRRPTTPDDPKDPGPSLKDGLSYENESNSPGVHSRVLSWCILLQSNCVDEFRSRSTRRLLRKYESTFSQRLNRYTNEDPCKNEIVIFTDSSFFIMKVSPNTRRLRPFTVPSKGIFLEGSTDPRYNLYGDSRPVYPPPTNKTDSATYTYVQYLIIHDTFTFGRNNSKTKLSALLNGCLHT